MKRGGPLKRYTQLKRGGPLRKRSKKTAKRERKAAGIRRHWKNEAGCCMVCGHSSRNPWPDKPLQLSKLVCHEILNGAGNRLRALDQPCAVLVVCAYCNSYEVIDKGKWPASRQLALLLARAPERYDLTAFNLLSNPNAPNRITPDEVAAWRESIYDIPRHDPAH